MKLTILALISALTFVGCSSTDRPRSPLADIAAQYAKAKAVQYATENVIGDDADKAMRIVEIVRQTRATLRGEVATTVAGLETYVRSQIDFGKLDAADTYLVNALIAEVRHRLEERLGSAELDAENALVVDEVLGWVEDAATWLT